MKSPGAEGARRGSGGPDQGPQDEVVWHGGREDFANWNDRFLSSLRLPAPSQDVARSHLYGGWLAAPEKPHAPSGRATADDTSAKILQQRAHRRGI